MRFEPASDRHEPAAQRGLVAMRRARAPRNGLGEWKATSFASPTQPSGCASHRRSRLSPLTFCRRSGAARGEKNRVRGGSRQLTQTQALTYPVNLVRYNGASGSSATLRRAQVSVQVVARLERRSPGTGYGLASTSRQTAVGTPLHLGKKLRSAREIFSPAAVGINFSPLRRSL